MGAAAPPGIVGAASEQPKLPAPALWLQIVRALRAAPTRGKSVAAQERRGQGGPTQGGGQHQHNADVGNVGDRVAPRRQPAPALGVAQPPAQRAAAAQKNEETGQGTAKLSRRGPRKLTWHPAGIGRGAMCSWACIHGIYVGSSGPGRQLRGSYYLAVPLQQQQPGLHSST